MADLDDFFAKKDRKKSKSTKKYATTEEIAKKLEDSAKKIEKINKERNNEGEVHANSEQLAICLMFCFITWAQDEWRDFEEEKKDYSGLKIGNLTTSSDNTTTVMSKENTNEQEEEESGQETEKKAAGPWKSINSSAEAVVDVPVETVEEAPINANVKSGRYLPPSMRLTGQAPVQTRNMNRSKAAPDIHNEDFFPTLSKNEPRKGRSEGQFELVQSNRSTSHRQAEQTKISTNQGPKLSLGNRYNGLSNDSW